ncbi:MAG: hypothetical protein SOV27_01030 [Eubacteriales bacterium]|nr:hypothetical protein [Eubacteriales bacterium]
MEIIMKDFDKLNKELSVKSRKLQDVLKEYALPNSDEIHNMICGYSYTRNISDIELYDTAESIDYFRYEKELCKTITPKT